jgi:hypothetical protein
MRMSTTRFWQVEEGREQSERMWLASRFFILLLLLLNNPPSLLLKAYFLASKTSTITTIYHPKSTTIMPKGRTKDLHLD